MPRFAGAESVLLATGILGATVMPHVIFLHSALTQGRIRVEGTEHKRRLFRYQLVDVVIATGMAGFVNAAMLMMAAATFPRAGMHNVGTLEEAYRTLEPLLGSAARALFAISLLAADLIVMCGHGEGGLRDLLFGSVAQRVSALGTTPVLFVRARVVHAPTPFRCGKLLVPTDGEPHHEQGLGTAREIARATGALILLLSVVPTWSKLRGQSLISARMLPGTTQAALEMTEESVRVHLGELASELRQEGFEATAEIQRGDPPVRIVATAAETRADLIVMATHGKTGGSAFWEGSVTPKVLKDTFIPVLLVPVAASRS